MRVVKNKQVTCFLEQHQYRAKVTSYKSGESFAQWKLYEFWNLLEMWSKKRKSYIPFSIKLYIIWFIIVRAHGFGGLQSLYGWVIFTVLPVIFVHTLNHYKSSYVFWGSLLFIYVLLVLIWCIFCSSIRKRFVDITITNQIYRSTIIPFLRSLWFFITIQQ